MKMADIRTMAAALGIKPGRMNKTTLIRTIQSREGDFPCFATATTAYCDQANCLWRADCLPMK